MIIHTYLGSLQYICLTWSWGSFVAMVGSSYRRVLGESAPFFKTILQYICAVYKYTFIHSKCKLTDCYTRD